MAHPRPERQSISNSLILQNDLVELLSVTARPPDVRHHYVCRPPLANVINLSPVSRHDRDAFLVDRPINDTLRQSPNRAGSQTISSDAEVPTEGRWISWRAPALTRIHVYLGVFSALFLIVVLVAAAIVALTISDLNHIAREEARLRADGAVRLKLDTLAGQVLDYGYWTDAYVAMTGDQDRDWVESNLRETLVPAFGVTTVYVFDPAGQPIYHHQLGVRQQFREDLARIGVSDALEALVAAAHDTEFDRLNEAAGLARIDNRPVLLGAAPLILEEQAPIVNSLPNKSILVFGVPLDDPTFLAEMARAFRLPGLAYQPEGSRDSWPDGLGALRLYDMVGEPIGWLTWTQALPGRTVESTAWILLALFAALLAGCAVSMVVLIDNTARHLDDARQAAEKANVAKSRFLSVMSHELRTPLNAIIGFSEVISREMLGSIGPRRYLEFADDIREAGRHLLSLVNEVIDLTTLEAGGISLSPTDIDARFEVSQVLRLFDQQASSLGITLENAVPANGPPVVADERALRQVLVNLVSNAVKFSEPHGTVRVASVVAGSEIGIQITDQGPGISEEDRQRILHPFEQGEHNAYERKQGGVGLGLSIVVQLIDLHRGRLQIDSTVGAGTTVTAWFQMPS